MTLATSAFPASSRILAHPPLKARARAETHVQKCHAIQSEVKADQLTRFAAVVPGEAAMETNISPKLVLRPRESIQTLVVDTFE